jgi:anti-anti-sigma factor
MSVSHFEILEHEEDGRVHLVLTGELDLASAPALGDRLARLGAEEEAVRLDLSRLEFIDSTGLHTLVRAIDGAQSNGWRLQIDPTVTPQVRRLFEMVGFEHRIPGFDSDGR